jgi:hypothetical protein
MIPDGHLDLWWWRINCNIQMQGPYGKFTGISQGCGRYLVLILLNSGKFVGSSDEFSTNFSCALTNIHT